MLTGLTFLDRKGSSESRKNWQCPDWSSERHHDDGSGTERGKRRSKTADSAHRDSGKLRTRRKCAADKWTPEGALKSVERRLVFRNVCPR